MTFAKVMDTVGLKATSAQYGQMFMDSKYSLWHANGLKPGDHTLRIVTLGAGVG